MVDFLAVRGLKTSGGKAELVACALLAVEFKLPNIEWSEEQQKDYDAERLKSTPYETHWVLKRQGKLMMWPSGHQYIVV